MPGALSTASARAAAERLTTQLKGHLRGLPLHMPFLSEDGENHLRAVVQDGDAVAIAQELLCKVQPDDAMATPCKVCGQVSTKYLG